MHEVFEIEADVTARYAALGPALAALERAVGAELIPEETP
jgi:hypothetical protein